MSCLYILKINHLCVVTFANIFSLFLFFFSFHLKYVSFTMSSFSAVQQCRSALSVHVTPPVLHLPPTLTSPPLLIFTEPRAQRPVASGSFLLAVVSHVVVCMSGLLCQRAPPSPSPSVFTSVFTCPFSTPVALFLPHREVHL